MIILIVIILLVGLAKHMYWLCNFKNLQMPDSNVKQNCCQIRMLGNKSDVILEINSITNVNAIRIYIGTTMGYPTQFSMSEKLNKGDVEYHTSVLHDEINFDWSTIEFRYQDEPIFFASAIEIPLHGKFKTTPVYPEMPPLEDVPLHEQRGPNMFTNNNPRGNTSRGRVFVENTAHVSSLSPRERGLSRMETM